MSGQPASGSSMSPFTQPGAESMPTSPLQNGVCGFSSLPSLAAPEACSISVWTVLSPSTDSGLDRAPSTVAVLDREVTAGVPDEGDAVAPVLAREPEAGEVGRVGVGGLEVDGGLDELVHRRRDRDAGRLEEVLAVEDVLRAGVVGHGVRLAVHLGALDEALEQVVAAPVVEVGAHVAERAGRGERRRLGVADLDHVRGLGVAGQRGGQLLDQPLPLLLLDGQRGAGVVLLERRLQPLPRGVRRVRAVEPDPDVGRLGAAGGVVVELSSSSPQAVRPRPSASTPAVASARLVWLQCAP